MKVRLLCVAAVALAACSNSPAREFVPVSQLSQEIQGRPFECLNHDPASDTCEAISNIEIGEETASAVAKFGFVHQSARGAAAAFFEMQLRTVIQDGRSCGNLGAIDVRVLRWEAGSSVLSRSEFEALVSQQLAATGAFCTSYYRDGDGYISESRGSDGELIPGGVGRVTFFPEEKQLRSVLPR